jgi:hypothetical protein
MRCRTKRLCRIAVFVPAMQRDKAVAAQGLRF